MFGALFNPSGGLSISRQILFAHGQNQTIPAAATRFLEPVYDPNGFYVALSQLSTPVPATLKNMAIKTNTPQTVTGNLTVTMLKNGVATGLVVVILAGSPAGVYSDLTDLVQLAGGDSFGYQFTNGSPGVASANIIPVTVEFDF